MKSAALELGGYGITVNALVAWTDRHTPHAATKSVTPRPSKSRARLPSGDLHQDEEDAKKGLAAKSPLKVPWIEPADVAPVVVFLASDAPRGWSPAPPTT